MPESGSQMNIREPRILNTQGCPLEDSNIPRTCFLPRQLGMNMVDNLVAFALYVWPRTHQFLPESYHELVNLYNPPVWEMSHVLYKEFCSCVLNFIVHTELSYLSRKIFTKLCCALICLSYSGSESASLNQHLLLSPVELPS